MDPWREERRNKKEITESCVKSSEKTEGEVVPIFKSCEIPKECVC